jgi:hypothetical protein
LCDLLLFSADFRLQKRVECPMEVKEVQVCTAFSIVHLFSKRLHRKSHLVHTSPKGDHRRWSWWVLQNAYCLTSPKLSLTWEFEWQVEKSSGLDYVLCTDQTCPWMCLACSDFRTLH